MDLLTRATLGATLTVSISPPARRRLAALVGAVGGVVPDADALIHSDADPLLVLDFHRHFTHSLLFVPFGALLGALLLWPFLRRHLSFARLYLFSLAGISCSSLLDACTSYGTHLLLPLTQAKTAWNVISVIDPLFTLLLLLPLLWTLRNPAQQGARLGLLMALAYLGLGLAQQQRVSAQIEQIAAQRQHVPERLTVKPTLGNLLLWRSLYIHDGRIYADATHAGWHSRHYPGESAPWFAPASPSDAHAKDIARFRHFSDDWLVQSQPGYIGDARYAMLPTAIAPIWGIRWDEAGRLQFSSDHTMRPEARQLWQRMLLGQAL